MGDDHWRYPAEFLEALASHGLSPHSETPPSLVRTAVNDLYRYELRRLRLRYVTGALDKPALHALVIATRKKYWVLSLSADAWERISRP